MNMFIPHCLWLCLTVEPNFVSWNKFCSVYYFLKHHWIQIFLFYQGLLQPVVSQMESIDFCVCAAQLDFYVKVVLISKCKLGRRLYNSAFAVV